MSWISETKCYGTGDSKEKIEHFGSSNKTSIFIEYVKAREFQKNIYFCFIDYAKTFDCVDHKKTGKFWNRWEYQTTWPASWETCVQVRKQLDVEQQTGSK